MRSGFCTNTPCTAPPAIAQAFLQDQWADPAIHTLVLEGTRVYSTVFRCAFAGIDARRALWTLNLLQTPEWGRWHIYQRCLAKNKAYRADFWGSREAEHLFARRYINAIANFRPQMATAGVPLGPHHEIWIEDYDATFPAMQAWAATALRVSPPDSPR